MNTSMLIAVSALGILSLAPLHGAAGPASTEIHRTTRDGAGGAGGLPNGLATPSYLSSRDSLASATVSAVGLVSSAPPPSSERDSGGGAGGTGNGLVSASFAAGRPGDVNGSYWDGRIDELGVWGRVLSPAEISELYNAGAGLAYPFGSPAGPPRRRRPQAALREPAFEYTW